MAGMRRLEISKDGFSGPDQPQEGQKSWKNWPGRERKSSLMNVTQNQGKSSLFGWDGHEFISGLTNCDSWAHHMFLHIKVYWNIVMFIYLLQWLLLCYKLWIEYLQQQRLFGSQSLKYLLSALYRECLLTSGLNKHQLEGRGRQGSTCVL